MSTSSQASQASLWPPSELDSEPSPSPKLTHIASRSWKKTSPASRTAATCEPETIKAIKARRSLQQGFLVSPHLSPGSEEAHVMTVGSGRKLCGFCVRSAQPGPSLRILLESLLSSGVWSSSRCFLKWRLSVTPFKRFLFQLAVSTRGISGPESGLWPTPNVPNGGRTMSEEDALRKGRTAKGKRQVGLESAVKFWPTPRSSPNENRQTRPTASQQAGKHGMNLATAVNLWATPTVHGNTNRVGVSPTSGNGLATQVGGSLNPNWVEWLMGYPIGWTDLKGSETPSSRKSRRYSSKRSGPSKSHSS